MMIGLWMSISSALAAGHHVVRKGESVESIAEALSIPAETLRIVNGLPGAFPVQLGSVLLLPEPGTVRAQRVRVMTVTGHGQIPKPGPEVSPLGSGP